MKNTKNLFARILSIILVTVLMGSMLVGCGTKKSDKDEQGRTIISVGDWPTYEGVDLDTINARKERFEADNPDVVVKADPWIFERKTFYAKAAGGQLPTLYKGAFTEVPEIIDMEYSADLTKALKKNGFDGVFNESILEIISDDEGNIKTFPTRPYVLGLVYNVELFEQAGLMEADGTPKQPKDWYEMAEFAKIIKKKTGKAGLVLPTSGSNGGWIFTPIAWSFGVEFMKKNEDGKWIATFDSAEAVAALEFYKDLRWKYDVIPDDEASIDWGKWHQIMGTGEAGMTIFAGDFPQMVTSYGMTPDQIGMMALPKGPKRHVTLLGGEIWSVANSATEDQVDAAVRWLRTAYDYQLTDEYKKTTEDSIAKAVAANQLVGIQSLSQWNKDSESLKWYNKYVEENCNSNINHVRLYNEFVANCPAEIQPEEPVCGQELYAILDSCIQQVLVDENANCAEILKKAKADFQANQLDKVTY